MRLKRGLLVLAVVVGSLFGLATPALASGCTSWACNQFSNWLWANTGCNCPSGYYEDHFDYNGPTPGEPTVPNLVILSENWHWNGSGWDLLGGNYWQNPCVGCGIVQGNNAVNGDNNKGDYLAENFAYDGNTGKIYWDCFLLYSGGGCL